MSNRTLLLHDGRVDLATGQVVRADVECHLTALEARLLDYLAENAGRDVPRAELLDKVWGYGPKVQTRAMDHTVVRLRTKVEADPKSPRHVITVHGVGYRFAPAEAAEAAPVIKENLEVASEGLAALATLEASAPKGMARAEEVGAIGLTPEERAVLLVASLFPGGFTEEAAAFVLNTDCADVLLRLCDKRVWGVDLAATSEGVNAEKWLLEGSVRGGVRRYKAKEQVYAWADLVWDAESRAKAERAHAVFFLENVFAGDDQDLGRLSDEQDNLLAIRERFLVSEPELSVRALLRLDSLYYARGPGYQHIELLNEAAAAVGSGPLFGAILLSRAEAWGALGDVDAAERDVDVVEQSAAGDVDLLSRALVARGNVRRRQARFEDAYALYERALALSTETEVKAASLRQLAGCDIEAGRFSKALSRFRELEQHYRADGNVRGVAAVLGAQGNIHMESGELSRAERCFRAAKDLSQRIVDRRREGILQSNLAVVLHERGQLDEARSAWEASLSIHREVVNRRFEGFALGGLGVVFHEMGRRDEARLLATDALHIFREVGDQRFEMIGRARLAVLGATSAQIRADLSDVGKVTEVDAAAIRVLSGFADLADADEANARGDLAVAAAALGRAREVCSLPKDAPNTSFQRISLRLLTAWLSRFTVT